MKWRSPRVFIPLMLVLVLLVGGGVLLALRLANSSHTPNSSSAYPADAVTVPPLPTPGSGRTTYTNSQFGYAIQYPTDWSLKSSADDGSHVRVFNVFDRAYPEAIAFDIECVANPTQLDAKTWWQQHQAPDGSERGIGPLTLASGAAAFLAIGHAQTGYTVYTLVHAQIACQIITYETDAANAKIVLASVNTFQWQ